MMMKKLFSLFTAVLLMAGLSFSLPKTSGAEPAKSLVVYFSYTGNTRRVAQTIAMVKGSDVFEIQPVDPYKPSDFDWLRQDTRVWKEHFNVGFRPEYIGDVVRWADYKTIYLGYPLWWKQAPQIVYTFVEHHDFTGKTVIPFCTSGRDELGDSADNLQKAAKTGKWKPGRRFTKDSTNSEIQEWVR